MQQTLPRVSPPFTTMDPEFQNPSQDPAGTDRRSPILSPLHVVQKVKQNLIFKSKWAELNGAMGDLGTYIPIVLALTLAKNLDLGTTLIFTGVYNFVTGAIYGVPMPVQPMKSIAAVAISNPSFGIPEVMAAGICTGGILFLLGVTGLMKLVYKLIPLPVVRGIQLAQGLSFAMTAVKYIRTVQNFAKSKTAGDRHWLGLDGLLLSIICACFIIIVNGAGDENDDCEINDSSRSGSWRRKLRKNIASLPSAFIIFLLGVILAIIRGPKAVKGFKFGPSSIKVVKISKHSWKEGFIKGTIPQLPLSVLNSVIAVCKLSTDLFPDKDVSATSVSMTVGLMNLVGCWFGGLPCCHGAGGLAGQYKFGGRSGGCVALLGVAKLVLGLVLGSSLVKILDQFPVGVLGVLLLFAGIELAICSRDMNTKEESLVMLICTAVSLVGSSAALGFLCGMVVHFLLRLRKLEKGQSWPTFWYHRNP
ncbi:molybdate transporter 1-like [Primulina tabacum]|uniref:molybdate transporter 1-like n=1 Tax=Primulina tabacum TaxID=48773 RepID=UPI003F59A7D7